MSHTFFVADYGLETSVDEVLSEAEFCARSPEDFLPNRHWFSVTVQSLEDQWVWINAYNDLLCANWTPNQSSIDREYYRSMAERAKKIMGELENLTTQLTV